VNHDRARAAEALALARSDDLPGAIAVGEAAIMSGSRDPGLTLFMGVLCCRIGKPTRGIEHLRRAVALAPEEFAAKVQLARALVSVAAYSEAREIAAPHARASTPAGREMQRIVAYAELRGGRSSDAQKLYDQLVAADPADFESWHGLGSAHLVQGRAQAAIAPLMKATQLRPAMLSHWTALAGACIATAAFDDAATAARRAVALDAAHPSAHLVLARALAGLHRSQEALSHLAIARDGASGDAPLLTEIADVEMQCKASGRAEASYRAARELQPAFPDAILGLANLFERTNRIAELGALLAEADAEAIGPDATALLRARLLREDGNLPAALAAARSAPRDVATARRSQFIGEIADRMGDYDGAFEAFSEANAALASDAVGVGRSDRYYRKIGTLSAQLTAQWHAGWSRAQPSGSRKAPLFIFGFPRSGTTLIDTMLSGHPKAALLEEEAVIHRTAERLGSAAELCDLSSADIDRFRAAYFAEVDRLVPDTAGRIVIDKEPLGLVSTPLLHRMFPDARYVFAQRHPCDVVLSCFITSAQFNLKIGNFSDLASTARLYDRVLGLWEKCRQVLPLAVYNIRYEKLIDDPQAEMRSLADFAELEWDARLIDHRSNAAARAFIGSPSYAQVAEPIYKRASGRWLHYRRQMEPVLPILAPWIENMGYGFD